MSTRFLGPAFIALVGACKQQPSVAPAPARSTSDSGRAVATAIIGVPVGRPRQDVEHFVPAFPAADSGGVCGFLPPAALRPGEWVAYLTFPTGAQAARRVTARYDSAGVLTYYSDRRGEISMGRVVRQADGSMRMVTPTGRRTEIEINVVMGFGLARNAGGDGPEEAFTGEAASMLDAPNLDYPRKMAALVRERCR